MQRSHERAQFSRVKLSLASPPTKRKLISYKASFNWSRSIRLSAGTQESSIPYKVFPWERSLIVHKMRSHLATVLKAEPCSPRENYVSARGQRSFEREREREKKKEKNSLCAPLHAPSSITSLPSTVFRGLRDHTSTVLIEGTGKLQKLLYIYFT